jgi:hypothetical protein
MAIVQGIPQLIPRQATRICQGFYLQAIGIRFTVVLEPPRRKFLPQLIDDLLAKMSRQFPHIESVDDHFS